MQEKRKPVERVARAARGQSTVEYALLLFAFGSMVLAWGLVWHAGRDGSLLKLAIDASSHGIGGADALGSFKDISLF